MAMPKEDYTRSRKFWLARCLEARRWASYSRAFRQKILDSSNGTGGPNHSLADSQRALGTLRQLYKRVR